jgi:hypothetical protein
MITIKLNNGTSFEVDSVNETRRIAVKYQRRLTFTIGNGDKDIEFYENLLIAENALSSIVAEGSFGAITFNNFVNISSIDRSIDEKVETRIVLIAENEE